MKRKFTSVAVIFLSTAFTLHLTDQAARHIQESSYFVAPTQSACQSSFSNAYMLGHLPDGGLGAMIEAEPRGGRLVSLIPGHAASKAGLKLGDRITAINGVSTQAQTTPWLVANLRGKIGTTVALEVQRGDGLWQRSFSLDLTRENIDSNHSVYSRVRDGELTIKVLWFDGSTAEQLSRHLNQATREDVSSVVLDLQNVSSGDLEAMTECASLFLPKATSVGYLVTETNQAKTLSAPIKTRGFAVTDQLTAVEVGPYTARTGELLAKSLAENLDIEIRGEATAGLGELDGTTIRSREHGQSGTWRLLDSQGQSLDGHPLTPSFWSWSSLLSPTPVGLE